MIAEQPRDRQLEAPDTRASASSRIANAITPVIKPAGSSGTPNSRFKPSAAPRNSAMSVDIAIISACTHSAPRQRAREALADRAREVVIGDDARASPTGTGSASPSGWPPAPPTAAGSRTARRPEVRGEVARIDVGDRRDERRAEHRERRPCTRPFASSISRWLGPSATSPPARRAGAFERGPAPIGGGGGGGLGRRLRGDLVALMPSPSRLLAVELDAHRARQLAADRVLALAVREAHRQRAAERLALDAPQALARGDAAL